MNWPVLKDKKWWISLIITMIFSITTLILVFIESEYWIAVLIITVFSPAYSVKRASKLTHGDKQQGAIAEEEYKRYESKFSCLFLF